MRKGQIGAMENPPTTFIVSQRTSAVLTCDKIIVLDNGEVVGIGTHEELLDKCELYKEIYDSQFRKEAAPLSAEMPAPVNATILFAPAKTWAAALIFSSCSMTQKD